MKQLLITLALIVPITFCNAQENEDYDPSVELRAACENTLKAWNNALNSRNEDALDDLYSPVVLYYQSYYTRRQVRDSHSRFFNKNAYYHQYYDNVEVTYCNGCQALLVFDKHVKTDPDGPYKTYRSYLRFMDGEDGAAIPRPYRRESADGSADI